MGKSSGVAKTALFLCFVGGAACYGLGLIGSDGKAEVSDKQYEAAEFSYTGDMLSGQFEGRGITLFSLGRYYEGTFKAGRFEGEGAFRGVFAQADGEDTRSWRFDGFFEEGRAVQGAFTRTDGVKVVYLKGVSGAELSGAGWKYDGAFGVNGQNGSGTFTFADGTVYDGEFLNGFADGEGTLTTVGGEVFAGIWERGELVRRYEQD